MAQRLVPPLWALAAALAGAMSAAAVPAADAPHRHHFTAVVCVQIDAGCPAQSGVPGLGVVMRTPASEAELVALLKAPWPEAGVAAPATAWLVAAGPLQAAPHGEAAPQLRRLVFGGRTLVAEFDYTPYTPVGAQARRFVPSYPVALIAMPTLAAGAVAFSATWTPRGAAIAPTHVGPLRLLIPW